MARIAKIRLTTSILTLGGGIRTVTYKKGQEFEALIESWGGHAFIRERDGGEVCLRDDEYEVVGDNNV